jgi:plastocyanin domain-containing protein
MKTKNLKKNIFVFTTMLITFLIDVSFSAAEWKVDFSRRNQNTNSKELISEPVQNVVNTEEKSLFQRVFDTSQPVQDIVILNTEQGFIPSTVRVKEGAQYRLVVVNINEKSKNISFVMDAFSEHHATYYGQMKTFYIQPQKEGVFTFISPETSAQGRLVVHPGNANGNDLKLMPTEMRAPASK